MTPLTPEPGWRPLTPFWESMGTRSFVSSDDDPDRIRVRYFAADDGTVWARAVFGPGAEGPPGHAHGGALAALLDEAMGMAALATGRIVVAARIEVDFRALVPLGDVVTVELVAEAGEGAKGRFCVCHPRFPSIGSSRASPAHVAGQPCRRVNRQW